MRPFSGIILLAVIALVSCTAERSPAEEAIIAEILHQRPELDAASMHLTQMKVVTTVTLGNELSYRERILTMKLDKENEFARKYREAGKKRNAARHDTASVATEELLRWLQGCRTANRESLSRELYHVVVFSAEGRGKAGGRFATEKLAVLHPDGSVWAFFDRGTNVRSGTGVLIPGYGEILERQRKNTEKK